MPTLPGTPIDNALLDEALIKPKKPYKPEMTVAEMPPQPFNGFISPKMPEPLPKLTASPDISASEMESLLGPPVEVLSPIDTFTRDQGSDAVQRLTETQRSDIDPTRQAKALNVSREHGVPPSVAYNSPADFQSKKGEPDFAAIASRNPATSKIMSDPEKGPVTKGDSENLKAIEDNLKAMGSAPAKDDRTFIEKLFGKGTGVLTPEQAAAEGKLRTEEARVAELAQKANADAERTLRDGNPNIYDGAKFAGTDVPMTTMGERNSQMLDEKAKGPLPTLAKWRDATDRLIEGFANGIVSIPRGIAESVDVARYFSGGLSEHPFDRNNVAISLEQTANDIRDALPGDKTRGDELLGGLSSSAGFMGSFLLGGAAAKIAKIPAWVGTAFVGSMTGGVQGIEDAEQYNASTGAKYLSFLVNAGLGATEAIPIDRAFGHLEAFSSGGISRIIAKATVSSLEEAIQEIGQQFGSNVTAKVLYDPNRDLTEGVAQSAISALLIGGVFGASVEAVTGRSDRATRNKARLDAIAKAINSSSTMNLAPDIVAEHIRNIKDQPGVPNQVTVSHDALIELFQSEGLDVAAVEKQFPDMARALDDAAHSGAEVSIPTEHIAPLAQLKGFQEFSQDVRLGSNEMTAREATAFSKDVEKQFADLTKEGTKADTTIFDNIKQQLVAAGQSQDVAGTQAALFAAVIQTQAERSGVSPNEMMARYGFTVTNSSIDTSATDGKTLTQQGVTNDQGTNSRGRDGGNPTGGYTPLKGAPSIRGAEGPDPSIHSAAQGYAQQTGIKGNKAYRVTHGDEPILQQAHSLPITEAMRDSVMQGQPLFQGTRGSITFGPARDKFKVTLTGQANLSTFLHEGGHFFLEIMHDIVERGEASAQQVADLAAVREWLGIEDGAPISTAQHEKFAKGFEAYLMEGKAPSTALASAFNKFKAWLVFIYKRLATLNVNLNDDIRSVMDRLVATDAAIEEARAQIGFTPKPMEQEATGLTDAEYKSYTEAWTKAHDAQQQDIDARVMIEAARATKAVWRDERAKVIEDLTAEAAAMRGNDTAQKIGAMEQKIQADSVPSNLAHLAKGLTTEEGLPLDMLAEGLGYASGEDMLNSIAEAKAAKRSIPERAKAIMTERHGDMNPAAISEAAARAVHNAPTQEVMLAEFRALSAKAGIKTQKGVADFLRQQAEAKIAQMTDRELDPTKWRRAELKAAEQAGAYAAKGKALEASLAKRRQMMAAAMYRATTDAQDRIQAIRSYLTTFTTTKRRAAVGKAGEIYLDGIDQILENIEFKDVSLKTLKTRETIEKIMAEAVANEEPLTIPDYLLVKATNYSKMTMEQLEGAHDAVKNLWTLAKLKNTLRDREQKRQLDASLTEMETTAEKSLGTRKARDMLNPTAITKAINTLRWVRAKLVKMEFMFGWLDGAPDGGLMHRLIYQPIADARKAEFTLLKDMHSLILDRLRNMPKEQKARWEAKRLFMGEKVKGANIIAAALNLGNESNKEKLLKGYKWEEAHLMSEINAFMTKEDWDIVQHIWDSIETLWPKIEKISQTATGLKPPKIERSIVETPHGDYSGGYYPVVYDPEADHAVFKRAQSAAGANGLFANNFMRPNAANGFTKERVKYAAPILLSLDVLSNHLAEVVHYVTHYEALTQADKITRHPRFEKVVKNAMGKEFYREIRPWLQDIANNVTQRKRPELGESVLRYMRNGVSIGAMGYNVGTAFKQLLGVATALDAISPRYWVSGIAKSWTSPNLVQNWKFALEESAELKPLIKDFDRDLKQLNDAYAKKFAGGAREAIIGHAFSMIGYFQLAVNVATWHGAYEQGLAQDLTHERAVDHADSVVRKTQSSGAIKDLADVQRSGEGTKILTMFYSFFSVLYNRLEDIQMTTKGVKGVPKAAMRLGVLAILPSILSIAGSDAYQAMFGNGDDKEDDAQSYLQRLATESANYVLGALPVLRGFLNIGHKPQLSPVISVSDKIYNSITSLGKLFEGEDLTRKQIRSMVDVTGIVTHTPGASIYKLVDDINGKAIADSIGIK